MLVARIADPPLLLLAGVLVCFALVVLAAIGRITWVAAATASVAILLVLAVVNVI